MSRRAQRLVDMGPATAKDGNIHIPSSSVAALERREVQRVATVPVHSQFAESLRAARAAGIIGAEVFTGNVVRGRILPMKKKAWAAKFKKYAVHADINEPKKSCHGTRKARAGVAACADYSLSCRKKVGTPRGNGVVTFPGNIRQKGVMANVGLLVRSEDATESVVKSIC